MLERLLQRWRRTSLQARLTIFYTGLLFILLLLTALTVQRMLSRDLERALEGDLLDTQVQFMTLAPGLNLSLPAAGDTGGGSLAEVRSQFPSSVIQVSPVVAQSQTQDLRSEWAAAKDPGAQQALLDFIHKQTGALSLRPVGIDPQQPLALTDAELRRLLESSDGRIMISRLVHPQFAGPEPMRVLVSLAPLRLAAGGQSGATTEMVSLVYVGRSLTALNLTLTRLQLIMTMLLAVGVLLAAGGAYLLAGWALRPLRTVRQAIEGIDSQNLEARVLVPASDDEVSALAAAFNRMLGRLQASFEAQQRFTSDASHELRTPVTAIGGHATYLLRRTELDPQQRESIEIIQRESARMRELIESLLHLARSDGGVLPVQRQPIFSQMLLHEIVRELRPLAEGAGATLQTTGDDFPFEGDPAQLRQVLNNLIINALKAGSGRVTLGAAQPEPGRVRLSVSDDGPGIPPQELEKLFDRFYRPEDSRSRNRGGAGLGLSIARTIVHAHGGRIWLESEVGRGTQAYVDLPVGDVPDLSDEDIP